MAKDETGRETRSWAGINLPGAELEISELVDGGNMSVVLKHGGKMITFDLPKAKLVDTMAAAARHLRANHPELEEIAVAIDNEVNYARRDQQRFGVE